MLAVRFHQHGGPEVLRVEEIPRPEPGPGEARVAVRTVALNRLDVLVRRGLPTRIEMPHVGGTDFAGTVDGLGAGVESLRVGERVVGFPLLSRRGADGTLCEEARILGEQVNGACCESLVLPAANLVPIPEPLSDERAACVPVAFTTAWRMLVERAGLRPGEALLVQGASSGVGTAAIQIGRHLGVRIIACTRGAEKAERARRLGAEQTIDPDRERVAARVRSLTDGRGADVVFEHVGEATWSESVASAAYGGRIVTCGATTGRNGTTNLVYVFAKELSLLGATLGSLETLRTVLGLVAEGRLEPVIDRVLPLTECRRGHEILESGEHFGKIVLRVAQ